MTDGRDRHNLPRTILTPEEAEARNLIPHLVDAGFELLDARHDDYIVIRDPGSGLALFLTDHRGARTEFRCYFQGRRDATTIDGRSTMEFLESAAHSLQQESWCQFHVDRDHDFVIRHFYLRGGGVLLGNLLHGIRHFAGLCECARSRLKDMDALEGDSGIEDLPTEERGGREEPTDSED
jgi:hypothetical protein